MYPRSRGCPDDHLGTGSAGSSDSSPGSALCPLHKSRKVKGMEQPCLLSRQVWNMLGRLGSQMCVGVSGLGEENVAETE